MNTSESSSQTAPLLSLWDRFERALNNHDKSTILSCFTGQEDDFMCNPSLGNEYKGPSGIAFFADKNIAGNIHVTKLQPIHVNGTKLSSVYRMECGAFPVGANSLVATVECSFVYDSTIREWKMKCMIVTLDEESMNTVNHAKKELTTLWETFERAVNQHDLDTWVKCFSQQPDDEVQLPSIGKLFKGPSGIVEFAKGDIATNIHVTRTGPIVFRGNKMFVPYRVSCTAFPADVEYLNETMEASCILVNDQPKLHTMICHVDAQQPITKSASSIQENQTQQWDNQS